MGEGEGVLFRRSFCAQQSVLRAASLPLSPQLSTSTSVQKIRVHVPSQTLDLLDDGELLRRYAVSTSRFGLGTEPGSTTARRSGVSASRRRSATARSPAKSSSAACPPGSRGEEGDDHDHVQTRILWLDGLEPGNANTYDRYVYIHGTNAESQLGTPASYGCVRMSNLDVIDLYDRVSVDTEVEIES